MCFLIGSLPWTILYTLSMTHGTQSVWGYLFVVVNFYTLAQASNIRIERIQVVFLC